MMLKKGLDRTKRLDQKLRAGQAAQGRGTSHEHAEEALGPRLVVLREERDAHPMEEVGADFHAYRKRLPEIRDVDLKRQLGRIHLQAAEARIDITDGGGLRWVHGVRCGRR